MSARPARSFPAGPLLLHVVATKTCEAGRHWTVAPNGVKIFMELCSCP